MMSKIRILGISGSPSRPSRTRGLVEAVVSAASLDPRIEASIFDLNDVLPELGHTLDPRQAPPNVAALLEAISEADALVVGSPVYKGTYSGLFKHLFDLVDPKALRGKPVVISATGGSDRHALALDHGLRPLFAFFSADIIPTALYGIESEFVESRPVGDALSARISRAAEELSWRLGTAVALARTA
jgi:FMN reductase